jgi:hypothetical protein
MATEANPELEPKQEIALTALMGDPNIKRAAEAAGVGERTLHRWLDEPVFIAAYRKARRQAFGVAISLTQKYAPLAVNELAKIIMDKSTPPTAKVAAITTMLKFSRESLELDDLAARLEALEAAAKKEQAEPGYPRAA